MDVPPALVDSSTLFSVHIRQANAMSLPSRRTRTGTRGYAHLVEIDVPIGRVWQALTGIELPRGK